MRFLFLVVIITHSFPIFGQESFIGLKGGLSRVNVNSSNFINGNMHRIRPIVGLTYQNRLNDKINWGIDFLYTHKGFSNDIIFTDANGNPTGEKATTLFNYDYLSLPIKGGYIWGNKVSGFANIGFVPSILVNAKTIEPTIAGIEGKINNVTPRVTTFDLGALIEVGGSYLFGNRFALVTTIDFQHSIISLTNNDYFSDGTARHYGITFSLGCKYAIRKKSP